jgi:hypothetical protein
MRGSLFIKALRGATRLVSGLALRIQTWNTGRGGQNSKRGSSMGGPTSFLTASSSLESQSSSESLDTGTARILSRDFSRWLEHLPPSVLKQMTQDSYHPMISPVPTEYDSPLYGKLFLREPYLGAMKKFDASMEPSKPVTPSQITLMQPVAGTTSHLLFAKTVNLGEIRDQGRRNGDKTAPNDQKDAQTD